MKDHIRDGNHTELYSLRNVYLIPEFVKEAEILEPAEIRALPAAVFADPVRRLYPVHTAADTWLSTVFFHKHAAEYRPEERNAVSSRLLDAIELWDLKSSFQRLSEEKEASDPVMVLDAEAHGLSESVVMQTPEDFCKVAEHLCANRHQYPYAVRRAMARSLVADEKLVETLPEKTADELHKTAGLHTAEVLKTVTGIATRFDLYRRLNLSPEIREAGLIMVKEAMDGHDGMLNCDSMDKIAGILDEMDRLADLQSRGYSYMNGRPAPENICPTGSITKYAVHKVKGKAIRLRNGQYLSRDVLQKHAADVHHALSGMGVQSDAESLPMMIGTLTLDESNMLCAALGDKLKPMS